jgi:phosphate transport system protein
MPDRQIHELINELSCILVRYSEKVVQQLSHALHNTEAQHEALQQGSYGNESTNLEERCLTYLALQQPVAKDLRAIVTIIKINDELHHISDLSRNIIKRMKEIQPEMVEHFGFENMAMNAKEMVIKAIDSFVEKDDSLARKLHEMDDAIDTTHRNIFNTATAMMKNPDADIDQLIASLSISRYIERMADHAVSIANEVIFLVTGEMIRHAEWSYEELLKSRNNQ